MNLLRKLRRERDQTLATVAGAVGIDQSSLSRIENGKQKPSLDCAKALADYYGIDVVVVLYGEAEDAAA